MNWTIKTATIISHTFFTAVSYMNFFRKPFSTCTLEITVDLSTMNGFKAQWLEYLPRHRRGHRFEIVEARQIVTTAFKCATFSLLPTSLDASFTAHEFIHIKFGTISNVHEKENVPLKCFAEKELVLRRLLQVT